MNAWHFILGAYLITAIVVIVEVLAVRARHRAALTAADESTALGPPLRGDDESRRQ